MELRHIRYFARAAELLHFTRAAESLYISQPTLSTHIQQLEEEFGTALFDRVGRSVQLTDAGNIFLARAQRVLSNIDVAKEKISDLKSLKRGTIRLGALLTFGPHMLPAWISTFHDRFPNIRIDVQTGTSDFIEDELQAGSIDLGLAFVPPSVEDLQGQSLIVEYIYVVVGDKHPFASRKEVDFHELGSVPLGLVSRRWVARRVYDSYFAKHKISPNVVIESDDLQALLTIASAGKVALLLARLAAGNFPKVRLIPLAGAPLTVDYGALWNSHGHLSPAAGAFLEHIKQESLIAVDEPPSSGRKKATPRNRLHKV